MQKDIITVEKLIIERFNWYVSDLFDSKLNLPVNNGGPEHSKVVLSKILTESKIDIKTLCSTLTNDDTYFD